MAERAVSGESAAEPGEFLTGANSSSRRTSSSATRSAHGKVSKMKSSSLMPCVHRSTLSGGQPGDRRFSLEAAALSSLSRWSTLNGTVPDT